MPVPARDLTAPETEQIVAALALPVKRRNTKHYKAIAKAAEKLAGDRLVLLEAEGDALVAMRRSLLKTEYESRVARMGERFWRLSFYAVSVAFVAFVLLLAFVARMVWQ